MWELVILADINASFVTFPPVKLVIILRDHHMDSLYSQIVTLMISNEIFICILRELMRYRLINIDIIYFLSGI